MSLKKEGMQLFTKKSEDERKLYEKLHEASEKAALIEAQAKDLAKDIELCFYLAGRINHCNMGGYDDTKDN